MIYIYLTRIKKEEISRKVAHPQSQVNFNKKRVDFLNNFLKFWKISYFRIKVNQLTLVIRLEIK